MPFTLTSHLGQVTRDWLPPAGGDAGHAPPQLIGYNPAWCSIADAQAFLIVLGGLSSLQQRANNLGLLLPQQQAIYAEIFQSGNQVRFMS